MEKIKKIFIDYFCVALGSFILAFATTYFLMPCKISTGGVGGVATILYYTANIPPALPTFIINAVLFFFGYKTLQKSSIFKTIVGIVSYSAFLEVTPLFGFYDKDILICSIFGGILVGVGVGLAVYKEASTGGSDFAALIINKIIPYIPIALLILIIDSSVIVTSGFMLHDYTIMFYSVISLYISSKVTDWILVRGDYAKTVYIISQKSKALASEIMSDMNRGVTGIYSHGCYSEKDNMMLMCVVKNKEIPGLLSKVKKFDKGAFTIISEAREVRGEGFKDI